MACVDSEPMYDYINYISILSIGSGVQLAQTKHLNNGGAISDSLVSSRDGHEYHEYEYQVYLDPYSGFSDNFLFVFVAMNNSKAVFIFAE